jgi:hypothetical protein
MGQKVGGYRRNAKYGRKTVRIRTEKEWRGNQMEGKAEGIGRSWRFEVNPKGRVGWDMGNARRTEKEYGASLSQGRRRRQEVEELRKHFGCTTNGLGRLGDGKRGYQIYGEYTYRDYPKQSRQDSRGKASKVEGGESKEGEGSAPASTPATNPVRTRAWTKAMEGRKTFETQQDFKKARKKARRRLKRKREKERQVKVERKRKDLKRRRERNRILRKEKEQRKARLGRQSKRRKGEERVDGVVRSGVRPMTERRSKLIAKELEGGRKHTQSRREIEKLRKAKAKNPRTGRKSRKEAELQKQGAGRKRGFYGYQVVVKGPLGGARRTMKTRIQEGTVPRGTKEARRRTGSEHAKTSIGTIGVKVSYCYGG